MNVGLRDRKMLKSKGLGHNFLDGFFNEMYINVLV